MKRLYTVLLLLFAVLAAVSAADVSVAALRGPTAMGLSKLMHDSENGVSDGNSYAFTLEGAPDAIVPMVVRGDVDIAAIPGNLASVLYNRTKGAVEVIGINTLGVLYIVENGDSVHSVEDLRGRTIYSAGKGATPEYALQYVLKANGLEVGKDVYIEWKSEHAECVASLGADPDGVAMLPQPFATTALMRDGSMRVALDLNDLWQEKTGHVLITGVTIARREFVENEKDALSVFLSSYADSVEYINGNTEEGAAIVGHYGIVPENVAVKAIPACNIVLITGEEMKESLSGYLDILYAQNPQSVGGNVPGDDFYYTE